MSRFVQIKKRAPAPLIHGPSLMGSQSQVTPQNAVSPGGHSSALSAGSSILRPQGDEGDPRRQKTVVAADDPELAWFREAARRGLADIVVLPAVGCEKKCAEHVYRVGSNWLLEKGLAPRRRLVSVEVKEHGANSAIYREAGRAADQRNI